MISVRNAATGVASLALLAVFAGCDKSLTAPRPVASSLVIEGACDAGCPITVGSEQTFSAVVVYRDGSRQVEAAVWTSDDAAVASVDANGRVRGISSGMTVVSATVGSLFARTRVHVVPRSLGAWTGHSVLRRCTASGSFDPASWCDQFYRVGSRQVFELHLSEENGRLSGGILIDRSGGGLMIDDGGSLDGDGRLQLSARGEGGLGFIGPFLAIIDPLMAQVRGTLLEGRFIMTVIGQPGSGLDGAVVVEADLDGVTSQ
jgi:hypothetical protein